MTDEEPTNVPFVSPVPTDRLTALCEEMLEPCGREENADVFAIVFLKDGEDGGIVTHGYEDQSEALTDAILHLQAMFRAVGKNLELLAPEVNEPTCDHCGAVLVNEDCPNYGNGPEHADLEES